MALINISGSIGTSGIAILGSASVVFTSDANYTLTVSQYTNKFLEVTSSVALTATRQLIAPLVQGLEFVVQNETTGGQSILVWGGSGGSVTVPAGTNALVVCDGANYFSPTSSTLSGDVIGNSGATTVVALQGNPILAQALGASQDGYTLTWSNSSGKWEAKLAPSGSFAASGDLSGSSSSQTVKGLYNNPLANTTPVDSAVPVWDGTIYDIRQLTADDIAPGFSNTGFSGGSTVEVGSTVTNPSFSASFSHAPTSANITNTDSIDSPLTLNSPFTSGTVVGSFTHTTITSVSFTLTAIGSSSRTAGQSISYLARSFGGLGTPGATGATSSGSNATLTGATGTLNNEGLVSSNVGGSYGPFSPTNQKIYLLFPHTASAHTFKDQNGFGFAMNTPTNISFTNQNGSVISMDLYESTISLSTSFTITVVS